MKVKLLGDTQGHVPSFFSSGEKVAIIGFREAFRGGNADNIIHVSNGKVEGWVKPSNIQKDDN
jgi:hypothetical protein